MQTLKKRAKKTETNETQFNSRDKEKVKNAVLHLVSDALDEGVSNINIHPGVLEISLPQQNTDFSLVVSITKRSEQSTLEGK
jgi:hypothetical protein